MKKPLSRVSPVQYSPRRQSRWVLADYGGKDLWKRWVLSLERWILSLFIVGPLQSLIIIIIIIIIIVVVVVLIINHFVTQR